MEKLTDLSRRGLLGAAIGASLCWASRPASAATAVNETGFHKISEIDQWIAIQGENARNPAILFLHGGPGEAQSPFLDSFKPWEQGYTVANWDQRGAGKTYGRNGAATPNMTLDRLVDDAVEVAEHVRQRLSQHKLILVGHSWGSFLGVHVARRRPDRFHAYVGTGQVVRFIDTVADQFPWARQQALAAGDTASLKALDDAAAFPDEEHKVMGEWAAERKWQVMPADRGYAQMVHDYIGSKQYPPSGDAADWSAGSGFSGQHLARFLITGDLRTLGLDMPVPFFVVQGRDDHTAGFMPAKAYVEEIHAPAKAFVPIDGGHYACFTNPGQFTGALDKYVRRLASG
jgi:pimeloyl-ACP methyl ester carboxylesterase